MSQNLYFAAFPDFGLLDVTLPVDFKDVSYRNDVCPSFAYELDDSGDNRVVIFVDYADEEKRECKGHPRFMGMVQRDGLSFGVPYGSDSWEGALLWARIEIMKAEVLEDMKSGRVPMTVTNFGDLHDHVDANCYGGFCEDDGITDQLRLNDEEIGPALTDFMNACQDAVSGWLATHGAERLRLCMAAHDLNDEFIAEIGAKGIVVADDTRAPYYVYFEGTRAALAAMLAEHWSLTPEEVAQDMADVTPATGVIVRNELDELNSQIDQFPEDGEPADLTALHAKRLPLLDKVTDADIKLAHPEAEFEGTKWEYTRSEDGYAVLLDGYFTALEMHWAADDLAVANKYFSKAGA